VLSRRSQGSRRTNPAVAGLLLGLLAILVLALIAWSTTWFDEDFEDSSGGWFVGLDTTGRGNWRISNGHYEVIMLQRDSLSRSLSPSAESIEPPFRLETTLRTMGGSPGEAGLVYACIAKDGKEEYRTFGVFADGSYRLGRILRGQLEDLPVATAPRMFRTHGSNTLRIEADGDTIRFYGNGLLLATLAEEGLQSSGEVGLFARSETETFFVARFDSVILSLPENE